MLVFTTHSEINASCIKGELSLPQKIGTITKAQTLQQTTRNSLKKIYIKANTNNIDYKSKGVGSVRPLNGPYF